MARVVGVLLSLSVGLLACSGDSTTPANDGGPGGDAPAGSDASPSDGGPTDSAPLVDVVVAPDGSHPSCTKSPNQKGTTQRTASGNPYVAYVPQSYDPLKYTPLVVGLHGAGDTAGNFLTVLWQANADARGFIVIAPEGTAPLSTGYTWNTSDGALVLAAVADVLKCYTIDPKKVILHGFSAGGIMAYYIGLAEALTFSGIAINSADLNSAEAVAGGSLLPSPWLIPVSHTHGTQDQNFPIQYALDGINTLSAAGHPTFWHPFNGGHTANAAQTLVMYDDLETFSAP